MPVPAVYLTEILTGKPIPANKLQIFRDRVHDRLFEMVSVELLDQEMNGHTTIEEVARRLGRDPKKFDRLMSNPNEWTLADFSDVCPVLFGAALDVSLVPLADLAVDDPDTPGTPRPN